MIILPFPNPKLFINRSSGKFWGTSYQEKKTYKEQSYLLTKSQVKNFNLTKENMTLVITFVMPDKRRRDVDGCLTALKSGLDGMADALGVNDNVFNPITIFRIAGTKDTSCVKIEIKD